MNPQNIYKPGSAANPGLHETEEKILPFPLQHLPPAARAMAEAGISRGPVSPVQGGRN